MYVMYVCHFTVNERMEEYTNEWINVDWQGKHNNNFHSAYSLTQIE
jgi:hypothetical protein